MSIYYIANARIPTEKAHGIHIAKMCEAFGDFGVQVILLVPRRKNTITQDVFSYYGLKKNFFVRHVPALDFVGTPIFYWISQLSFSLALLFQRIPKSPETIILTRDILSGFFISLRGYPVFFDMHGLPREFIWFWRMALDRMRGVILTNNLKKKPVHEILNVPNEKIMVAPNGHDPKLFEIRQNKEELRKELGLPLKENLVVYAGHLYDWKGASPLAEAARLLLGIKIVFIGGTEREIALFRAKHQDTENIIFIGQKPYTDIPKYLKSADVLVFPGSRYAKGKRVSHSVYDASPIKLFEYMASGTPIVATRLPSVLEILSEKDAELCEPDDIAALARAIKKVIDYPTLANERALHAFSRSKEYTWRNRAENISRFIKLRK